MHPLGSFFLSRRFALGKREREIVIARVTARCGCEYEWGVHATAFGAAAGLDEAALRATVHGTPADPALSTTDRLLVRLVDELHDTARVSDDLWRDARGRMARGDAARAPGTGRLVPRDRLRRERPTCRARALGAPIP
jgi:alkylhydroperoxidase family enzyme